MDDDWGSPISGNLHMSTPVPKISKDAFHQFQVYQVSKSKFSWYTKYWNSIARKKNYREQHQVRPHRKCGGRASLAPSPEFSRSQNNGVALLGLVGWSARAQNQPNLTSWLQHGTGPKV